MSDSKNVSTAKPKVGGAIFSAPLGTTLPTSAISPLNAAFKNLGYISEDGVTNTNTPKGTDIVSWGGDIVAYAQENKSDTFAYMLIEGLNIDVLKEVYGEDNVTGDLETGISITANSKELEEHCIVIDTILKGGIAKRLVLPCAKVTDIGDITYGDKDIISYATTVTAYPDQSLNTHYDYMVKQVAND